MLFHSPWKASAFANTDNPGPFNTDNRLLNCRIINRLSELLLLVFYFILGLCPELCKIVLQPM